MIELAKWWLYKLKSYSLRDSGLKLAYIFHTEKIYQEDLFKNLIEFCEEYERTTGAKAICAVIPPTNALLKQELQESGFSEDLFISRIHQLAKLSTIGYHGHFYQNDSPTYYNGIHCHSFNKEQLVKQFERDLKWFENNRISHNGVYCGGWWFFNEALAKLLIENHFSYDFSFSRAHYFYNSYSNDLMNRHQIKAGEPFKLKLSEEKSLNCVQNFIGMHNSPFPQDFDRLMSKLTANRTNLIGVVNSHDYDLNSNFTIRCIEHQIKRNGVEFFSFDTLKKMNLGDIKTIQLVQEKAANS